MGYIAELNSSPVTASVTLAAGAGTAQFGAFDTNMAVKGITVTNSGGSTTAGATFTLKANGVALADWAIPNGYTAGATVYKTPLGIGPASNPTGAAGPLPATGAVTSDRQVLPAQQDITLAVASGTGTDVLTITLVLVPGGNLDEVA